MYCIVSYVLCCCCVADLLSCYVYKNINLSFHSSYIPILLFTGFENQEYHFNISSVSRNEIVRAAELYLFTMKPGTLLAYDVTSGHNLSPQSPGSFGWISMNITSVFQDWLENPQSNRGIRLIGEENLNYEQYPWLVVYTDYEEKAPRPTSK